MAVSHQGRGEYAGVDGRFCHVPQGRVPGWKSLVQAMQRDTTASRSVPSGFRRPAAAPGPHAPEFNVHV